jgi:flavin-dependent dehydrogenase
LPNSSDEVKHVNQSPPVTASKLTHTTNMDKKKMDKLLAAQVESEIAKLSSEFRFKNCLHMNTKESLQVLQH